MRLTLLHQRLVLHVREGQAHEDGAVEAQREPSGAPGRTGEPDRQAATVQAQLREPWHVRRDEHDGARAVPRVVVSGRAQDPWQKLTGWEREAVGPRVEPQRRDRERPDQFGVHAVRVGVKRDRDRVAGGGEHLRQILGAAPSARGALPVLVAELDTRPLRAAVLGGHGHGASGGSWCHAEQGDQESESKAFHGSESIRTISS